MVSAENVNWADDEYWRTRRLSPAQLQIFDVHLAQWVRDEQAGPILEIDETLSSTLLPTLRDRDRLASELEVEAHTQNRQEQTEWRRVLNEYGWMNCLRSKGIQTSLDAPKDHRKLRWVHISSKFTEYLQGCLLALSDWTQNPAACAESLRQLENSIYQNERFSKHGRYFTPFFDKLNDTAFSHSGPLLVSVPFLDWSTDDPPPLRFQIDPREGYQSSRSTSHLLRSILQHFYRLEDTSDREHQQVFSKHKPWLSDRELDLKVRRFYGQYPEVLNVDELWILVIDSRHIVTFASNQSWKSRWPPLQLSWRIAEVSFRGIRNTLLLGEDDPEYTAHTHVIACLSGALGILHRAFWTDITLCLTDRFAGHLGHLQYRLHRAPSTKLVMDLLQVQEELNIIIAITQSQIDLLQLIDETWKQKLDLAMQNPTDHSINQTRMNRSTARVISHASRATFRQYSSSTLKDPMSQLLENLKREFADLVELRDNSNNLLNRTIQLVNIRLEDHGKAILVFTIVTIIFLPLSFVSSFFGMNTIDIRNMSSTQGVFWIVSSCLTVGVVGFAIFLAFYGGAMLEAFFTWKANRSRPKRPKVKKRLPGTLQQPTFRSFEVLDSSMVRKY